MSSAFGIISETNVWAMLHRYQQLQVQNIPLAQRNSAQSPAATYQVSGNSAFNSAELQSNYFTTTEHGVR